MQGGLKKMGNLSILGSSKCRYMILSMVVADQSNDINGMVQHSLLATDVNPKKQLSTLG